jgi:hypothetical protein
LPLIAAARAELAQRGVRTLVNTGAKPVTQAPRRPTMLDILVESLDANSTRRGSFSLSIRSVTA